jgi:hypothetical protein
VLDADKMSQEEFGLGRFYVNESQVSSKTFYKLQKHITKNLPAVFSTTQNVQ